jgi:acyl carrier protein
MHSVFPVHSDRAASAARSEHGRGDLPLPSHPFPRSARADEPGTSRAPAKRLTLEQRLRAFIAQNFYLPDTLALGARTPLIEEGIVDSTGLLEIVAFLEKEFHIEVLDEDVVPENMETIERMTAYVARKTAMNCAPAERA